MCERHEAQNTKPTGILGRGGDFKKNIDDQVATLHSAWNLWDASSLFSPIKGISIGNYERPGTRLPYKWVTTWGRYCDITRVSASDAK